MRYNITVLLKNSLLFRPRRTLLAASFIVMATMATLPFDPAAHAQNNGRVLDVQKRRVVVPDVRPADAGPTSDVLIIGGGVGGVAAADALIKRGYTVIIAEPTSVLGGQLTAQMVPLPDENSSIEKQPGPSTLAYRDLREAVRARCAVLPDVKPANAKNIGQCWVSRVSAPPQIWAEAINERLSFLMPPPGTNGVRRVYFRHVLRSVGKLANGKFNYADLVDLDTGRVTRIGARFLLDATEDGSALAIAGLPTVVGQEAASEYGEKHAPEEARPDWIQSFTYCFAVQYLPDGPRVLVEKPAEYEYFKSLGEYTLDYVYSERGVVTYKVFAPVKGGGGPFWTYRRLLAASSFTGGKSPDNDIALINWRGNDFHDETYLDKSPNEAARILERGRAFAQGFVYWLQNECPRDDETGFGYPEMQLLTGQQLPGAGDDGFALHPYIRESRRLKAQFTLTENHMGTDEFPADAKWGAEFDDSVGCALYAIDIHPTLGEPPLLVRALPYELSLGCFLTTSGPVNVLPAAKNIGATRLASASARMHPTEWLSGEVAGTLAAFCIQNDLDDPALVRNTPDLLRAFQTDLRNAGVSLSWREILGE